MKNIIRNIEATGSFYVVATDSFMSGWGLAPGRSLYAVACENIEQAENALARFETRPEFQRCRINDNLPKLRDGDHLHAVPFAKFSYGLRD